MKRLPSWMNEYVKEKYKRMPLLKPFARLLAKRHSGHSFAVVAWKKEKEGGPRSVVAGMSLLSIGKIVPSVLRDNPKINEVDRSL